jgi:Fe/S biogenesis protein NfuA
MTAEETSEATPVIKVTDEAREKAAYIRSRDEEPERLALWLEVTGEKGDKYTYSMSLQLLDDAGAQDVVQHHDDLPVVVPADSVDKLRGSTLYRDGDLETGGIVLDNPNTPSPSPAVGAAEGPAPDLSGDIPQRVIQVLEQQINPSIAAHGGKAELVAVDGGTAYLQLSGGCQGCGMASVTLTQGIQVAITDAVPEVTEVTDVTDHAAGTNPYYQPSKK